MIHHADKACRVHHTVYRLYLSFLDKNERYSFYEGKTLKEVPSTVPDISEH